MSVLIPDVSSNYKWRMILMVSMKSARQSLELTQEQMARWMGVRRNTINRWEMKEKEAPLVLRILLKFIVTAKKR